MAMNIGLAFLGLGALQAAGTAIYHSHCMAENPVRQKLWDAALEGDATTVRRLLRQYNIPVDTMHHVHGTHLVLDIAKVETQSEQKEKQLQEVLQKLEEAGWDLAVKDKTTLQNALHALVQQWGTKIQHRLNHLVQTQMRYPKLDNMLAADDSRGKMPEQVASWTRLEEQRMLQQARGAIERAVDAMEAAAMAEAVAVARAAEAAEAAAAEGGPSSLQPPTAGLQAAAGQEQALAVMAPQQTPVDERVLQLWRWGEPVVEEPEDDE